MAEADANRMGREKKKKKKRGYWEVKERWRVRWFVVRVGNGGEKKKKREVKRGVRKLVWLAEQLPSFPTTPSLTPSSPSLPAFPSPLCFVFCGDDRGKALLL